MLILLKQNNEEIAHLLGVSRSTVLKNRYRLRCKLQLPGGVDLDTEVRSLLAPEEEKDTAEYECEAIVTADIVENILST